MMKTVSKQNLCGTIVLIGLNVFQRYMLLQQLKNLSQRLHNVT